MLFHFSLANWKITGFNFINTQSDHYCRLSAEINESVRPILSDAKATLLRNEIAFCQLPLEFACMQGPPAWPEACYSDSDFFFDLI